MTTSAEYRALADRVAAGAETIDGAFHWLLERRVLTTKSNAWEFVVVGAFLDAVEALRVAKLPGSIWIKINQTSPYGRWVACLRVNDAFHGPDLWAHTENEISARLAALLRAMAAQMEEDDAT